MKDYLLIMREGNSKCSTLTDFESEEYMTLWCAFMENLTKEGNLKGGLPLNASSRLLTRNGVSEKEVCTVNGEIVSGYLLLKATDYEHALRLASGCPIIEYDGSIEIREAIEMLI